MPRRYALLPPTWPLRACGAATVLLALACFDSFWRTSTLGYGWEVPDPPGYGRSVSAVSSGGRLRLVLACTPLSEPPWAKAGVIASRERDVRWGGPSLLPQSDLNGWSGFGVTYRRNHVAGSPAALPTSPYGWRSVGVAYWLLILLAVGPLVVVAPRVRRRAIRERDGLCLACGYDVRASRGRCPECGAVIPGRDPDPPAPEPAGPAAPRTVREISG